MEFLIILVLVLLNGIFAMSEMALVSSKKFKLENARNKGNQGAKAALELAKSPTKFLSTVQIGITLIGILLGVYSGDNLTKYVIGFIQQISFLAPYASQISTGIIVIFITFISILLGELLPKRIGMTFPETIIKFFSRPMKMLSVITSPFVWLLTASNNFLLRIFGIKIRSDKTITEEEIKSIIKKSAEGGEILDIEQNIVNRVFELGDRRVKTLYTHRRDLVFFNVNDNLETIKQKIDNAKHSAYPVSKSDSLDDFIGIVLIKDLFSPENSEKEFHLKNFIIEPLFFNENAYAYRVLEQFKQEKLHYGIVVDEYGTIQGMVTMDDILDALVGEATESNQEDYEINKRDKNTWLVDGQYSIIEFAKYFDLDFTDDQYDKFTTVAGLVIYMTNELPKIGQKVQLDGYELEVLDKDGLRIDKILVTRIDN